VAVTRSEEEGKSDERNLLDLVRRRVDEEEPKLVAFVKESLQPRFSTVDLRAVQYGIIIQAQKKKVLYRVKQMDT
jgi:hypothetical protein